ncbi:SRPBCC family protein [Cohnella algarum]|uniref:SRPBCC family protein n=1 Tax=Cohnella algarum TaxID=2044859 RepID=UPI00196713D5|nr:SRPBCC family protein [Cohnella algarum]MBN2981380.1 SRPBCC family protein [Cohnella algarum]
MLAVIQKTANGYTARYERRLKHPVAKVWAMLTENEKLAKWFSELSVDDLREGGVIKFDMQDGTFEEMEILELKAESVLEYTWGEDRVRFELYPEPDGCRLVLIETIAKLTDHTPKDVAGWDVCLDVIEAVLAGRTIESSKSAWEIKYEQYAKLFAELG